MCTTYGVHISHEVNSESVFSIESMLSDPTHDPRHLQLLVHVKSNRAAYEPDWESILQRYTQMFRASYEEEVLAEA